MSIRNLVMAAAGLAGDGKYKYWRIEFPSGGYNNFMYIAEVRIYAQGEASPESPRTTTSPNYPYSTATADKATDGYTNTEWILNQQLTDANPAIIIQELYTPKKITKLAIYLGMYQYRPFDYLIKASNDGINYVIVKAKTTLGYANNSGWYYYDI